MSTEDWLFRKISLILCPPEDVVRETVNPCKESGLEPFKNHYRSVHPSAVLTFNRIWKLCTRSLVT